MPGFRFVSDPTSVVPFNPGQHDRSDFQCGEESLDQWLKEKAKQSSKADTARTYVVCEGDKIIGYYCLSAFSVEATAVPAALRAGYAPVPCILLGRLAVDNRHKGQGLGDEMMMSAFYRVSEIAETVGARALIVHALHERAASFYLRLEFVPFEEEPLTLHMPTKAIRATLLEAGWLESTPPDSPT